MIVLKRENILLLIQRQLLIEDQQPLKDNLEVFSINIKRCALLDANKLETWG